ncbi:MAG TPA: MBL fold metallo-hydrolase [Myxococcota bacterium]|nr:MBL fold metallo-hydrolase [Myxococcota bacterium]
MVRGLLGVVAAAALVFGGGWLALRVPAVQDAVARRVIARAVAPQLDPLFSDDALRAYLCGSGSPLPHATRAKACVAVFAAGRFWIVDTGPGSWNRLALSRIDPARIGAVFLTHFHSDHIGDLGEFNLNTWVAGRPSALRVFGPPGVERVVAGFSEAYALDTGYRIAHHGADFLPADAGRMLAKPIPSLDENAERAVVLEENGLTVSAFQVHHDPVKPAYGYRFDYRGRSIVISGDTAKCESVARAAKGADVLFHEAQANHLIAMIGAAAQAANRPRAAKIMADIPSYHTTPVEAAEIANEAGVHLLVLYHLNPPPPTKLIEPMFARGVDEARHGDWTLGDDGLLVELPAGTDRVIVRKLD